MKYFLLLVIITFLFFSCKKELVVRDSDYIATAKQGLRDSLTTTDFGSLDFAKASRLRVDSIALYALRVPFVGKIEKEDFVLVQTDGEGNLQKGKIVHLQGKIEEKKDRDATRKVWNGSVVLSSLDRTRTLQSPVLNGYIAAFHQGSTFRTTTEVVEGLMPEVIIVYTKTAYPTLSWSEMYLFQGLLGLGGVTGGYYSPFTTGGGSGSGSATNLGSSATRDGIATGGDRSDPVLRVDREMQDENPPIDIQKFINCFSSIPDAGAICSIEIMTDIPVDSNPNKIFDIDARSPGHTFLRISKSNGTQQVTQNIGFYPSSGYKSITYAPVPSKMVNNAGHEFNASLRMLLTPDRLKSALQAVLLYKDRSYDVDQYNCTDFALDVFNSVRGIGLTIPLYGIPGSPVTQATRTPGGLYSRLQQMKNSNDPEKGNITIGIYKGYAGSSHGPCN